MEKGFVKLVLTGVLVFLLNTFIYARSMSLEEAIKVAKDNSPELRIKKIELEKIRNNVNQFKTGILPKINFIADKFENHLFESQLVLRDSKIQADLVSVKTNRYDLKTTVDQNIIDPAFIFDHSSLRSKYKAAVAGLKQFESNISNRVIINYYSLIKSELTRSVMKEDIEILEEYLKHIKTKAILKFEERQTVINTEISLQNKKQDLYKHDRDYYVKKTNFARLLLIPLTLDFSLSDFSELKIIQPKTIEKVSNESCYNDALKSRWDIKELESSKKAFIKQRKRIKAENLPKLSIHGSYGYLNENGFNIGRDSQYWTVNFRAKINIFNGFYDSLKIKEADLNLDKTEKEEINLRQKIESEINIVLFYLEVLEKMYKDAKYGINISEENLKNTSEKLILQQKTKEDLLTAKLAYNNAKLKYVQTKVDLLLEQNKYNYILGKL